MTAYIASYDTESPRCLGACKKIVEMHRRHNMPATFFITGKTLEANPDEYASRLSDPLFEIASHTYSHKMLRDHPFCGPAASPEQIRTEIFEGKAWVERVFDRPCVGLRPGCCFVDGLRDAPDVLSLVKEAGYRYISSVGWGPDYSLPAPLTQPYAYVADGFPELVELPGHGWHENLLKNNNRWGPRRITLWPPQMPEAIPTDFVKTPEDEVAVNRVFLERAASDELRFVSLIWHPWSLHAFDPEMRMLGLTFELVHSMGLRTSTYASLRDAFSEKPSV